MTAPPSAVLALWNSVDRARDAEYEHWHAVEHAPERVWAPGFLGATRYVDLLGEGPRYFTLYEVATLDALGSAEYQCLVQQPTPWSRSMRPSMGDFIRKPVVLTVLDGERVRGAGGLVSWRAVWDAVPQDACLKAAQFAAALRRAVPDIVRVGCGWVREAGPQAIANVPDAPPGVELVVWAEIEGEVDAGRLAARQASLRQAFDAAWTPPRWQRGGGYRVLTRITRTTPDGAPRPPPRMDLMAQYQRETT